MSSLKEFHRQRAKVVIPKSASLRRYRRRVRPREWRNLERTFGGILPKPQRLVLAREVVRLNARHSNVMDPYRFPPPRESGRAAKMCRRGWAERHGRMLQVLEVARTLDLVHRARGRVGYVPRPDWDQLPTVGR
jgi:hypothetical protein